MAPAGGRSLAAHDTIRHSGREYARGFVHANSVEGFNDAVRHTIAGRPPPYHIGFRVNPVGQMGTSCPQFLRHRGWLGRIHRHLDQRRAGALEGGVDRWAQFGGCLGTEASRATCLREGDKVDRP
jgi:hypothetical protein